MVNLRQAGQRRWLSLLAYGSFGLATALTTGCSATPVATGPPPDPLYGVLVPPGMPQPTNTPKVEATPTTPTPQAYNPGSVPAFQASMNSSNPATLAATNWQGPLGRPLAIDDNNSFGPPFLPGQSTLGNRTQQVPGNPGFVAPNPNPKVESVPDLNPVNQSVTPTNSWQSNQPIVQTGTTTQPTNAELLSKRLQERGVLDQKQELTSEGLHLTCYVSRGPGGGLRILEVTAADFATAAQAILQQLETGR